MKVTFLWIQQQDGEHFPLLRIQAPRHLGGEPKIGNPLGAGLYTEFSAVIFQGVSHPDNGDFLVNDGRCSQDTIFNTQWCTHNEPFFSGATCAWLKTVPTVIFFECLQKFHLHPCSTTLLRLLQSSLFIQQPVRTVSLILLTKIHCVFYVKGTGLAAWLNRLAPQVMSLTTSSRTTTPRRQFSRGLCLFCFDT